MTRHVVAMGGGGFSMEPDDTTLDDYVLSLVDRDRPRVCFLATASGDASDYVARFHRAFPPARAQATHLPLFARDVHEIEPALLAQDVIYVGGGNTANMLAVWRLHGVDRILADAWEHGVVLAGLSAGAMCWFEAGVTDSFGPLTALEDGLGLLEGSFCPHYDGQAERRPTYHRLVAGGLIGGYAVDDGAALHFVDGDLSSVVASRPHATAYRVARGDGGVEEVRLEGTHLG